MCKNETAMEEEVEIQKAKAMKKRVEALQEGKLPSNEQIGSGISSLKEGIEKISQEEKLSNTGKELLHETEKILESARQIVTEKNRDEKLQESIYHYQKSAGGFAATWK